VVKLSEVAETAGVVVVAVAQEHVVERREVDREPTGVGEEEVRLPSVSKDGDHTSGHVGTVEESGQTVFGSERGEEVVLN
jgi:hypothetical protein